MEEIKRKSSQGLSIFCAHKMSSHLPSEMGEAFLAHCHLELTYPCVGEEQLYPRVSALLNDGMRFTYTKD